MGIASAGGAGRALAEWIVEGEPTVDLVAQDIRRFAPFNGNNQWLRDRVGEILGLHYEIPWPNRELVSARPFRRSPVYHLLAAADALFGSKMGWERANVFAPPGQAPVLEYTWDRPDWLAWSAAEQERTRQAATLFDETSFGKLLIVGRDAEQVLQRLCTADVAVPVGRAVYTGMLNRRGGYEADVTVTRLDHDRYLLVTGSASVLRDLSWIGGTRRPTSTGRGRRLVVHAVYGVMGPRSRELLQRLTRVDLSDAAFPFATSREIDLGHATVRATRITYVGELGWELYVPTEFAVGVYEQLLEPGRTSRSPGRVLRHQLAPSRQGVPGLRGRAHPGPQPGGGRPPFHVQARYRHRLHGPRGRGAGRGPGAAPPPRVVPAAGPRDHDVGWRARSSRDGVTLGQVTSAAWSATVGSCVGLAYVWDADRQPVTPAYLTEGTTTSTWPAGCWRPTSARKPPSTRPTNASGGERRSPGGLPRRAEVTRLGRVSDTNPDASIPGDADGAGHGTAPGRARLARARAAFGRSLRSLLSPDGLPTGASEELEAALGDIGREALAPGPGRLRRVRAEVAAAPPRMLDWMSTQVIAHPAVVYDVAGVEALASRQTKSIQTAVGALQLALVGAASASTLEGGPILALAIDGVVGQAAAVVHGVCDWYSTGSYLVRRLDSLEIRADVGEVRRITNAALMSRGQAIDERMLARSTELRLIRRWSGNGLVDALPFGSSLGKASIKAVGRIDHTDLDGLVAVLRSEPPPPGR